MNSTSSTEHSKTAAKKTAAKKTAAKKTAAKAAKKTAHCWPGFQPVAGKTPGTKGSCEPKPHQTAAERRADARAAAARRREGS